MADEIPLTGKNKSIDNLITKINKMKQSDLDTTQLEKQLDIKKAAFPKLFEGTKEYQKAKETKAKGGMIRKYNTGGFIARGCGKVMDNRRKKTKCY